jgi:putative transposase
MRLMGFEAAYKLPWTTTPHLTHPLYPELLNGLRIERPNQVWCADITFIPIWHGLLDLVAIIDWATRKALSWRLSNTLRAHFCIEALEEAQTFELSDGRVARTDRQQALPNRAADGKPG